MEWVEVTGRTVEEAKEAALDQLGVSEADAEVIVVSDAKTGLSEPESNHSDLDPSGRAAHVSEGVASKHAARTADAVAPRGLQRRGRTPRGVGPLTLAPVLRPAVDGAGQAADAGVAALEVRATVPNADPPIRVQGINRGVPHEARRAMVRCQKRRRPWPKG
jgi:hypothetical protein